MSPLSTTDDFRLDLMASGAQIEIAVPLVSAALDLPPEEARGRLAQGPGTLASGLSQERAGRLATMLRLLGLPVRVVSADDPVDTSAPAFDMALQVTDPAQRKTVAQRLSARLGLPAPAVTFDLARPGGLQRQGLAWSDVCLLRRRVRGIPGVQMLVSDRSTARFDLLPFDRPENPARLAPLLRFLRRLGLATCPLTGAVAADVDQATATAILRRFADCGLFAFNRDFQRFDLLLMGTPVPVQHEMASFLSARTALPPQTFCQPEAMAGLRIEGALSRSDALAFQADYAAMGLETRLRLVLERGDGAG